MQRRNILLAVSSLGSGGAERVATTVCDAWAARGDQVTLVVTFSGRGQCFYPISDKVQVIYLADRVGSRSKTLFNQVARLLALRRLIGEKVPDVVVSFLTNVNVAAILATRGLGIPVIACERTNPNQQEVSRFLTLQRQWTYPLAEMLTVQTEELAANLGPRWHKARRLRVVPNPLPLDLPAGAAGSARKGNARPRLLAMGRLVELKQFDLLVQAFHGLAGEFPDWDMWVFGEGPLRSALEGQVASLGLAERVFLPGRTQEPWVELAQADAFVLSSRYEGFPNVLLEAMAMGLPCVSFECPSGPREMTRDGQDGLLVPVGDDAGLAAALGRLMEDKALRRELGARAAVSVRERYSLQNILALWDRLFDEVMERV